MPLKMRLKMQWIMFCFAAASSAALLAQSSLAQSANPPAPPGINGYYRDPAVHGDTLVFAAEGDLWTVGTAGGVARRLTTHPAEESHPVISPDGQTLAFTAKYEGPTEVYTMPLAGGLPVRRSFEGEGSFATTFTPRGELVYATPYYSTLPDLQLVSLDLATGARQRIPLSQASEGAYDSDGRTMYFVRPAFHNNVTRWYTGGTARQIWKFSDGANEAERLTRDYKGESHSPMAWNGRVYFVTDRDRTMNLWSMNASGGDLRQHTDHKDWDVRQPSLHDGRIAYVAGADIWSYDIASQQRRRVPVTLASDLDQLREKWVTRPIQQLTSMSIRPDGNAVVLTARGRVFVAPARDGRLVQVSRRNGVRYRDVVYMPDGKSLLGLTDASGELEFTQLPPNGVGAERPITADGKVLRFKGVPSPDGRYVAYVDNDNDAWLLTIATRVQTKISQNREGVEDFAWSPDSRHLVFAQTGLNTFQQLVLYDVVNRSHVALTSDRVNSHEAAWSPDGAWLYFLSDRNLASVVGSPWGTRQPEPFFDKPDKIYQIAMRKGSRARSPFKPADELQPAIDAKKSPDDVEEVLPPIAPAPAEVPKEPVEPAQLERREETPVDEKTVERKPPAKTVSSRRNRADDKPDEADNAKTAPAPKLIRIDYDGLAQRVYEVPAPPGDYSRLSVNDKALYYTARGVGSDAKTDLMVLEITNQEPKPTRFLDDVRGYELARNGKKLLARRNDELYIVEAGVKTPTELEKSRLKLSSWSYAIDVREDWRQLFIDAWRLERDYFYDPDMHGVDWNAVRDKYLPLVDRVTTREELSDLIGLAVGELSALHTAVREGDLRRGADDVKVAGLGARLLLDTGAGGYRIDYIYQADTDYPEERSPLADPQLDIAVGDVITLINGVDVLSVGHPNALLRNQNRQQVLLRVKKPSGMARDVIVMPIADEPNLRYSDWELTRRQRAEQLSNNQVGYVHLRAMTPSDITSWFRNFYPVFNRQGLIIDARHNRGGSIDSFILSRLLRQDWMYWKGRAGQPYANMHYAYRGHIVVLVDENTASDGEAFAEGIRRLGLGKVIGVRTWGGEIWLDSQNRLSDGGFARAPSAGVYGPEGKWLIEQHGVDPDIVVENLPHATFNGGDAQLDAAVSELLEAIRKDPRPLPQPPPYPKVGR